MYSKEPRDDKGFKIIKHCSCGKVYKKDEFLKSQKVQRDFRDNKELGRYLNCMNCKSTMFLKTIVTFLVCFMIVSCGTNEQAKEPVNAESIEQSNDPENPDSSGSVYASELYSLGDLPVCQELNNNQLIFVIDENAFYTCKLLVWKRIEIKGDVGGKGDKGDAGTTTNVYQNASITNVWVDAITGYEWVLGTVGSGTEGETRCSGQYLMPTLFEAVQAANNGLLTAAAAKGLAKQMWTSESAISNHKAVSMDASFVVTSGWANDVVVYPIHCKKI